MSTARIVNKKPFAGKREYRPASLSYFIKSLLSVIITGESPVRTMSHYRIRKTKK